MAEYETEKVGETLHLTPEEQKSRELVYKYLQKMWDLKNEKKPHFTGPNGARSWLKLVDDSEKILNGYTLSRASQGKEDWQSNMMDNISRVKMRAIAAGVGLKAPEMTFRATDQKGIQSKKRAEVFKHIIKHTYTDGNPSLHSYQETWHLLAHGTIFEYEGFRTGGAMREVIESFDTRTGEVKTKKQYIPGAGKPFSVILNPQEFYWWDFHVRNVQDQPRIAWVQHYTRAQIQQEFGEYKNYKYLKDKANAQQILSLQDSTFYRAWADRVGDNDDYEVVRIYSKEDNLDDDSPCYGYEVWVNGVPMIRSPLLWGEESPMYPFAVQKAENYANTNFFVGMPFGQIVEAYQEHKNTVINTMIDKLYRSMKPPYLVGLANRDLLDDDRFVDEDNRWYVPDVNQVKPFPYNGINQGELSMLGILDRGIESYTVDKAQQGQASGSGKTAREVVIANERAQELKGVLYLALEDLWYQKTKLRMQMVLTHYLKDKATQKYTKDQMILIPDYTFGDGAKGMLAIHLAKSESKMMSQLDVEARAYAMEDQGMPYKVMSLSPTYFDEWQFDFEIVPKSMEDADEEKAKQDLMGEIQSLSIINPQFVAANADKYTAEILELNGKNMADYNPPAPPQPAMQPGQPGQPPQPGQSASNEELSGMLNQLNAA